MLVLLFWTDYKNDVRVDGVINCFYKAKNFVERSIELNYALPYLYAEDLEINFENCASDFKSNINDYYKN